MSIDIDKKRMLSMALERCCFDVEPPLFVIELLYDCFYMIV